MSDPIYTDETTQQPQGPLTNYELKNSKVDLLGQKNVSLDPSSSAEIRMKLMQMIQEREAKKNGWGDFIDTALALSGDPVNFNTDWNNYQKNKRERDLELMQMYSSVGQLNTEEQRTKMMREKELASLKAIENAFNPQASNSPLIARNLQENEMASRLSRLPPEMQQGIKALLVNPETRAEGWKQYIAATKPSEFEDKLNVAGVTGPMRRAVALGNILPNVANLAEVPIPGDPSGSTTRMPLIPAIQQMMDGNAFNPGQPQPQSGLGAVAPSAQPEAPTGGLEAVAPAPAPAQARPAPAPAPAQARPAPAPAPAQARPAPAPAPAPKQNQKYFNRYAPGSVQWQDEQKKIDEQIRQDIKAEEDVRRAEETSEAQETGKRSAAEKAAVEQAGQAAGARKLMGVEIVKDLDEAGDLVGGLGRTTAGSAFLNAISQGIQFGNFGSVSFPAIGEIQAQLSPELKKLPPDVAKKKWDAYQRLIINSKKMALEYAKIFLDGQGAVSNNERDLVMQAVGDVNKLSSANLKKIAIGIQIEAANAREIANAWNKAQSTMKWSEFKRSDAYKQLKDKQEKRTMKLLLGR